MFFSISASLQKSLNRLLFADFAPRIKEKITIQLRRIYFDIFTYTDQYEDEESNNCILLLIYGHCSKSPG